MTPTLARHSLTIPLETCQYKATHFGTRIPATRVYEREAMRSDPPTGARPGEATLTRCEARWSEAPQGITVGQLAVETDGVANACVPRAPSILLSPLPIKTPNHFQSFSFKHFRKLYSSLRLAENLARIRVFTTYANRSPASSTSSTTRSSSSSSLEPKSESLL